MASLARLRARIHPDEPGARRRRDRVLLVLFALLSVVLVERAASNRRGVLLLNQQLGARYLAGEDLYFDQERGRPIHTPYPPSFVYVCAPLSLLPTPVARRAWCVVQLAALAGLYRVLRRRLREHWPAEADHALLHFALGLLLVSRFVLRDMKGGGGNTLYVALAIAGVDQALRARPARGGALLAASLVIKPMFAPLLLLLAMRRRLAAIGATVAIAAALFWLPAVGYGREAYGRMARQWFVGVVEFASMTDLHSHAATPEGFPPAEHGMNQSLREAVHRLLRPPGDSGAHDVRLLTTSAARAVQVSSLLGILLLALLGWRAARAPDGRSTWWVTLAFLPLCLLLSPITWKAHHAALLPLMVALSARAWAPGAPRWLVPLLVADYVACNLLSVEVVGDGAGDLLQALSVVTWFDLGLIAAALALSRRVND